MLAVVHAHEKDERSRRGAGNAVKDVPGDGPQAEEPEPFAKTMIACIIGLPRYFACPMSRRLILPEGES